MLISVGKDAEIENVKEFFAKEKKQKMASTTELEKITDGKPLNELMKVTSSRNCDVFKINENLFLTAIKEKYYADNLAISFSERKNKVHLEWPRYVTLPIHDIVSHDGNVIGYTTDSFDMTLKDFFIKEDPSLVVTKIILGRMKSLVIHSRGHGDIDLVNMVIKGEDIFLTNHVMKESYSKGDMDLLNAMEREILEFYGHPCGMTSLPIAEADCYAYNFWYYLLINTSGEERKRLIEAGMENVYRTLFDDIPNVNINEDMLNEAKKDMILKKEYYPDGEVVHHFSVGLLGRNTY